MLAALLTTRPLRVCVCVVLMSLGVSSSRAEEAAAPILPESVRVMLQEAAQMDEGAHLLPTARLAARTHPGAAAEILGIVARLAPDQRMEIAQALQADPAIQIAETELREFSPVEAAQVEQAGPAAAEQRPGGIWPFLAEEGWSGDVELGASVSTGNSEDESLFTRLALGFARGRASYEASTAFEFERADKVATKQRLSADLQANYDINTRTYAFAALSYEDDRFSGFSYRLVGSPGLGYHVFDAERFQWAVEAGPAVRRDKIRVTGDAETTVAGRTASDLVWVITDRLRFENVGEIIVDGGWTAEDISRLRFELSQGLSAGLGFEIRHSSEAPLGAEKTDTTTRASLNYAF